MQQLSVLFASFIDMIVRIFDIETAKMIAREAYKHLLDVKGKIAYLNSLKDRDEYQQSRYEYYCREYVRTKAAHIEIIAEINEMYD